METKQHEGQKDLVEASATDSPCSSPRRRHVAEHDGDHAAAAGDGGPGLADLGLGHLRLLPGRSRV